MNSPKSSLISRFLLVAVASISLSGCYVNKREQIGPAIDTETVMEIIIPYAVDLEHEKQLRLEDSSISYSKGNVTIQKIRLHFISQSILELREARELIVDITEGLIDNLNNDPFLGDYLVHNQLSSANFEICIKFESYLGLYLDKMYIHWIMLQNDYSHFYAFDLTNEFNLWNVNSECWHQCVEPYFKSRQIVDIRRAAEKHYQDTHQKPKSLLSNERYEGATGPKADQTDTGLPF